ncbi:cyclin-dependent kinase inhibitor 1B-like [Astyanax mexicanus]|uniref:Cyclin-dependent kinase inhibitor 1B n=1 Tax=Astyanax mexicanus TaxID=7994 RepID=A0A8T2M8C4_ASTMX|nr:cyclin-dependent kinase inhibitor 1B-like [Astyanax mexicanus]
MSDVRLSNGSPPLERVDARLADHTRLPVRRNLFGGGAAPDSAEFCTEQLREQERALREKYNFDFARDEPLAPGQFVWEAMDGRSVPDFYSRPPRGSEPGRSGRRAPRRSSPSPSPSPPNQSEEDVDGGGGSDGGGGGGGGGAGVRTERTAARSDCRGVTRKRRSTEQQDGASQSKRVNGNSDAEEANHCPPEQTPRKSPPPNT